jgi:hypothetical protein
MKFRIPAAAALLVVLGSSSIQELAAQPVAPVRSPGFTPFLGVVGGGGRGGIGVGGYYGIGRSQQMMQLQNELNYQTQTMQMQQAIITNMVNMSLPQTGRGAVYNSLGHWYPSSRYGGGYGMGSMGGMGMVQTRNPLMNASMMGGMSGGPVMGAGMMGGRR